MAAALFIIMVGTTIYGQETVPYTVEIRGVRQEELLTALRNVSQAVSEKDRPPSSMLLLRRRVENDVTPMRDVLAAQGYFGATVEPSVNEEAVPVQVVFNVSLGPLYKLSHVEVDPGEGAPDISSLVPPLSELGLALNTPATADAILDGQQRLIKAVQRKGYPYPAVPEPRVEVDHSSRTVRVFYSLAPGSFARFEEPVFAGNETVKEDYLRGRIPWKAGDPFNIDLLEKARKQLMDTQLFSVITIEPAGQVTPEGTLPVTITVTERPPRTIMAGIRFSTDEGAGAHVSWEHRNLFHAGQRLELRGIVSSIQYSVEANYTIPDFWRRNEFLRIRSRIASEHTDAYDSNTAGFEVDIERRVSDRFTIGGGGALKATDVKQQDKRDSYLLFSLPQYLSYDTRDGLLDPTRGGLLTLRLAPTLDLDHTGTHYVRALFSVNQHFKLKENPRIIFATRLALGSIIGADREDVPPDDRFYAGGGGSVRGYGYQMVGPLDKDDNPLGGRSLLEFSTELRVKVAERVGVVTFLDGGGVWPNQSARFDSDVMFGAGFGARYFSPIGPLRLDIAFPLERRGGVDAPFQIYLSMGQAF
jgi:translocation and assembly module TamA